MNDIENTQNRPAEAHLSGMLEMGQAGYLQQIEAQGQKSLVESTLLPTKIIHYLADDSDESADFDPATLLEEMGITLGKIVPGDPLFRKADLPAGWTKRPGENSLWSYVIDDRGLRRIAIFFKAVFYDRRAHLTIRNAGQDMALDVICGKEPVAIPEKYVLLTDAEKAQFAAEVDRYVADWQRSPQIYEDGPRADELLKLVAS